MSFINPIYNDLLAEQLLIIIERIKKIEDRLNKIENKEQPKEPIIYETKLEKIENIEEDEPPENNEWIRAGDLYKKSKKRS
jgi:hypothetical protein